MRDCRHKYCLVLSTDYVDPFLYSDYSIRRTGLAVPTDLGHRKTFGANFAKIVREGWVFSVELRA
jgi:hypothetical protein